MAIVTVGDLLDRAQEFEKRLEDCYAAIRDQSQNNGVRLLTYYLSKHRRRLRRALTDLDADRAGRIRRIELKYADDFSLDKQPQPLQTPPADVTGEELLNAAIEHDTLLVALYNRVLQQSPITEAQAFFEALVHVEERDIVMLKKMLVVHYF